MHNAMLTEKMTQEIRLEGEANLNYKRCLQQTHTDNQQVSKLNFKKYLSKENHYEILVA